MLTQNPYQYQAGPTAGAVTFTGTFVTGASMGGSRVLKELIFAPTLVYQKIADNIVYHKDGTASVGYMGIYCLSPNDVSFANVTVRETDCLPTIATGTLSIYSNQYHMAGHDPSTGQPIPTTLGWSDLIFPNKDKNPDLNTWIVNYLDQVGIGPIQPDAANYPPTGYGTGKLTYQIPVNFHLSNGSKDNSSLIQSVLQSITVDSSGTATVAKGGVSASANAPDPYVGPFPPLRYLNPGFVPRW